MARTKRTGKALNDIVEQLEAKSVGQRMANPYDLIPHPQHKYNKINEKKFQALQASIQDSGIAQPIAVIKIPDQFEKYYILSGHNRNEAAKALGLSEVPIIIQEEDEAKNLLVMNDTNLVGRGDDITLKEWVYAVQQYSHALRKKAGRPSNATPVQNDQSVRVDQAIADRIGKTRSQVITYMKLIDLIEPLLDKADCGKINISAAFNLAFLTKEEQQIIDDVCNENPNISITVAQSKRLKELSQSEDLTPEEIIGILEEDEEEKFDGLRVSAGEFKKQLPASIQKMLTNRKAMEIYEEAMSLWREKYKL